MYQTKNALTFPLSGPGSVGMEYCFVNMVAPGDKVVVAGQLRLAPGVHITTGAGTPSS